MAEPAAFPSQQTSTIFYGWWVVFAAAVGIALHIGPVVVGTFGVFLAVPFLLMSLSFHGCILHLVPLLTDRGLSPSDAATAASMVGAGGLVARLGSGFLLDLFFAPSVAIALFSSSTIGLLLLWSGAQGFAPFAAGFLVGIGQGAELDIIPYMVSRYFGSGAFAHIYGYLFAAFLLGAVLGPPLMGFGFDLMGSYGPIIGVLALSTLFAVGLISRLGPYPEARLAHVAA
ncbi:MAG TPA: hypothetical protein VKR29_12155 [Candidatus Binataceae bacterium]|nr:hypothetical protein [Candidatus Binataceae bacterium]